MFLKTDCGSFRKSSFKDDIYETFCKARHLVSWGTAGDKMGQLEMLSCKEIRHNIRVQSGNFLKYSSAVLIARIYDHIQVLAI